MASSPDAKYEDLDWDALPAEIQAAYVTLGWYKAMWEAQAEPDSEDMEWDELSAEQQTAAAALGYDKESWNKCHCDE